MSVIKIKPISSHHSLFLMLTGLTGLLIVLAVSSHFWQQFRLVLIFCALVSLVIVFIGIVKKLEPKYSLTLTKQLICYQHKYGRWQIAWHDIQRIGEVLIDVGLDKKQLPYVGIKLKNENTVVNSISLRLASRLPHEQRPLTTFAISQSLISFETAQINFEPYKLKDETGNEVNLKGAKAFFMHHTSGLHQAFGYHLYLPAQALDRSVDDFIELLKQCLHHATNEHN